MTNNYYFRNLEFKEISKEKIEANRILFRRPSFYN